MPDLPDALARKLETLPDGPGVYLWKDARGEVLYVGKAKRLSSRVRSYFAADFSDSPKHQLLRRLIADVETIVVGSEAESLILENNLIKEYRPRFNVRLKDDKSYPSIAVTLGEPFPRVLVTRRRNIDGAKYFGPYTDVAQLRRTLAIIRRLYTVRSCSDDLPRRAARAPVPRLSHRPLQGAVRRVADSGRLPGDGRGTSSISSRAAPGTSARRCARRCWRRASGRTTSGRPTCATRCAGSSGWRSHPAWSCSAAVTRTRSGTPGTATTPWACSCASGRDGSCPATTSSWKASKTKPTRPS